MYLKFEHSALKKNVKKEIQETKKRLEELKTAEDYLELLEKESFDKIETEIILDKAEEIYKKQIVIKRW